MIVGGVLGKAMVRQCIYVAEIVGLRKALNERVHITVVFCLVKPG